MVAWITDQPSLYRVLGDVLNLVFEVAPVADDAIEAFVHPHRTGAVKDLVNSPGRSTLDVLEHLTQVLLRGEAEDQVNMIGHHHCGIEFDSLPVAGENHFKSGIQSIVGKRFLPQGAKGDKVCSSRGFQMRQASPPIFSLARLPRIERLEAAVVRTWNGSSSHLL